MQSDLVLRAKVRDLMASGLLPRVQPDGSFADDTGRSVPGLRQVGSPYLSAACMVCEEPGPQVTYQVLHGLVVYLHSRCDTLWQEEQRQPTQP
jgi:hypothetical protein